MGFTSIIAHLISIKKPIIMHNGMIDSLHLYDKFVDNLPGTLPEFKENFNQSFNTIFDTKYILNSSISLSPYFGNGKLTSLGDAYNRVLQPDFMFDDKVEINPEINSKVPSYDSKYEINGNKSHEAGFDSFMTGVLFYKIMSALDDNYSFNPEELFHGVQTPLSMLYRNRIPITKRTPINLNVKRTSDDGVKLDGGFNINQAKAE